MNRLKLWDGLIIATLGGMIAWTLSVPFPYPNQDPWPFVGDVSGRPVVAVTEDSPGWDCLRQGNVTCRVDGVLVTSLEGLPADPFGRCVFLLEIVKRIDPDGVTYADGVCGPVRAQLG